VARVGIDARQVSPAGKGHARSQRRLVESLAELGRHELVAFVREEGAGGLLSVPTERIREPVALLWEQVGMPRAARRLRLDAFLTLGDRLPVAGGVRFVVWLFELPTHRMATTTGLWNRSSDVFTALLWKRSLRRAARVVGGSQATARELEAAVPELAGKVRVIYPGLDAGFWHVRGTVPQTRPEEAGRYAFHLGSADPRDNTETVVEAFRRARSRLREPLRLVIGGDLGGRTFEGVETTGRLSDQDLAALYRGATAYLDATLYEGFGYQPLEAMASGAPVIASSASSIPEVVGDAGLLCDPRSPDELADAIARVVEEPGLAAAMREKGLARAATFTWERTAREFADVLDEVTR
jgi:glycosyltransferase involved in cell wall biosynthesis